VTFPYQDAVAVVSGASSGLGRGLALELARRGATVVAVARREPLLDELLDQLRLGEASAERAACDVADLDSWSALLDDVARRHGRIDVLVNAAGIERRQGVRTVRWTDLEDTMAVNFAAAARGTLAVLPGMLERRHGAVVNISSDHGRAPGPGTPAYCASKAALSAFTESAAHEVAGTGVHVHVLYPGWVPTPLGQGAVDQGMPMPPRAVRRTEQDVVRRTLDHVGRPSFEINAARVATLAPAVRALLPAVYRRSMRRVAGGSATPPPS
jgi:short-subunit dehydrogenase